MSLLSSKCYDFSFVKITINDLMIVSRNSAYFWSISSVLKSLTIETMPLLSTTSWALVEPKIFLVYYLTICLALLAERWADLSLIESSFAYFNTSSASFLASFSISYIDCFGMRLRSERAEFLIMSSIFSLLSRLDRLSTSFSNSFESMLLYFDEWCYCYVADSTLCTDTLLSTLSSLSINGIMLGSPSMPDARRSESALSRSSSSRSSAVF